MTQTSNDLFSFGALLKALRKRRRLTQQHLAEAIGVHRIAIGRWEQGDFLPESKTMVLELARHLHLDDQETRHLLEASLTALSPYWLVPLPRNPFFTGREEILEELHTQLDVAQAVALTQSSALHGLGGVGKTQIALEYAYRHALEYSAVFWVGAEIEEQIVVSLLRIAEVLQLQERDDKDQQHVIAAVQRWLSMHGQWLLICDNVEDLALLDRFLPCVRQGAILITTCCQTLGTLARGLDLRPMEQEEGMLFLLRRAKILKSEATREQMDQFAVQETSQYAAAAELVRAMGGLPLALDQAGAYLEETQCGLPAYLDLFRTQRAILLQQRGEGAREHPESVATTFTLALTATAERHPAVWDLLQVCALVQPDAIPEELFRLGDGHLGAPLEVVGRDALNWDRVVAIACAYSMLSRQPEKQMFSMHRLVQAVLLDTIPEAEQEQWTQRVIETLDAIFPEMLLATEYAAWKQGERLLPHVRACLDRVKGGEHSLVLASLAYKTAQYLRERGQYAEAEPLYQRALRIREQVLGPDHPDVASSLNFLAVLYWQQGTYTEAESLYQRVLRIREQALGRDHLEVATTLHYLAILYAEQGKYELTEPLNLRALRIAEQTLGSQHRNVAYPLHGLADFYQMQGKYAEAEAFYLRALHIREQALGPDHPDVAYLLHGLANLSQDQGTYTDAEAFYQRALSIREQVLGSDHPLVGESLNSLANLFREQGKYAPAEPLYQRALALREQHLGQHHPKTAETLHDLALFYQKQGTLSKALSLAERALKIRSQSLGDAHPKTVATQTLSAQLVQEQADAQEETAAQRVTEGIPGPRSEEGQTERPSLPLHETEDPSPCKNDPFQGFLDACCELHPRAWCRSADLWQAYERWGEVHQERYPLSRRAFLGQVKAHGCRADRTMTARIWRGIAVVQKEP